MKITQYSDGYAISLGQVTLDIYNKGGYEDQDTWIISKTGQSSLLDKGKTKDFSEKQLVDKLIEYANKCIKSK